MDSPVECLGEVDTGEAVDCRQKLKISRNAAALENAGACTTQPRMRFSHIGPGG